MLKSYQQFALSLVLGASLSACDSSSNTAQKVEGGSTTEVQAAARIKPHGENDPHLNLGPEQYAMVALGHLQEGRHNEAMQSINRALSSHPESAHLFAVRSQIYLAQQQKAPALADLERAISYESDNASLYVNRAAVYSSFDRDDAAMADLNRAIILDNDMLAARFNRGSLHFIQENLEAALSDFEHCISVDPHTPAPYFNRAAVLDAMGQRPEAIADIERFLQLSDDENWRSTAQALLTQWQGGESATAKVEDNEQS